MNIIKEHAARLFTKHVMHPLTKDRDSWLHALRSLYLRLSRFEQQSRGKYSNNGQIVLAVSLDLHRQQTIQEFEPVRLNGPQP